MATFIKKSRPLPHEKTGLASLEAAENPGMVLRGKNGLVWLSFPEWEESPLFIHAFSTRIGGVSRGIFSQWDVSYGRGNSEESVRKNIRLMGEAVGFSPDRLVVSDQTHSLRVRRVGRKDFGKGYNKDCDYREVDGLVSNEPGIVLMTLHADCVPLYFIDPVTKSIGLAHAGWRGTAGGMAAGMVKKMQEAFGTNPAHIHAAIGPAVLKESYEVGEDVAHLFASAFLTPLGAGKYLLDLAAANKACMEEAGIASKRILLANIDTCRHSDLLFSQRALGNKRGNNAAFLGLRF